MNLIIQFIFNFLINSIFMFITVCLLVEFFLFIFRISNFRLRYIFRTIPIFKLLFDLVNYSFLKWAFKGGVDPQLFQEGKRFLGIMARYSSHKIWMPYISMGFNLENGKTFSIADYIFLRVNPVLVNLIIFSILFISLAILIHRNLFQRLNKKYNLKKADIKILNPQLMKELEKRKIKFYLLDKIASPFIYRNDIILPNNLQKKLNKTELEAIISHELHHIVFKDNLILKIIRNIKCFFWYIPGFEFWIKRLSTEREKAADQNIKKFAIHPIYLANAIKKVGISQLSNVNGHILFLQSKEKTFNRISILLKNKTCKYKWLNRIKITSAFVIFLMIIFGRIWIF